MYDVTYKTLKIVPNILSLIKLKTVLFLVSLTYSINQFNSATFLCLSQTSVSKKGE